MIRKTIKHFSILMIALLVIVLLMMVGAHFTFKTDHAQHMIKTRVNAAIPGNIHWKKADISILGGRVDMFGVTISDPEKNGIIDSVRLLFDIQMIKLLRGTIEIVVHLDRPRVMLSKDRDGEINIIQAFVAPDKKTHPVPEKQAKKVTWSFPFNVIFQSVILSDGYFEYLDYSYLSEEKPQKLQLDNIHLNVKNANLEKKSGQGELHIGKGLVDMGKIRIPLNRFFLETAMNRGKIEILEADVQIHGEKGGAHLVLAGSAADIFKAPAVDFKLDATAALTDINEMFSLGVPLSGMVRAMVSIEGTGIFPESLEAKIKANISGKKIAVDNILAPIDPEMAFKGTFKNGKVVAEPVTISICDTQLQVSGDYDMFNHTVNTRVSLATPDMAQFLKPFAVDVSSGATELLAMVNGNLMQPEITIDLNAKDIAYNTLRIGNAFLDAKLEKSGSLFIERLFIDNRGSEVDIKGRIDLFENSIARFMPDMPANLTAVLRQVSVSDFYPQTDLGGKISGRLDVGEKIISPSVALSIEASDLAAGNTRIGNLSTQMKLLDGTLAIEKLDLENGRSMIRLAGTADLLSPGSLSLLSDPKIDMIFPESILFIDDFSDEVVGRVTIKGHAKGLLTDLGAELKVTARDLKAGGNLLGDFSANVGFFDGRLSFSPLKVENQRSNIVLNGGINLLKPGTLVKYDDPAIDLDISGDGIYIGDFVQTLAGKLTVTGHVNGSVKDPKGNITLTGDQIDLGIQKIERVRLVSLFTDKTLLIDPMHIALAQGESIRAKGHLSIDKRFAFQIESDDIPMSRIDALADTGLSGVMNISASGKGTVEDPDIDGVLFLHEIRVGQRPIDAINVAFELKNRIATAVAASTFTIAASYHLQSGDFELEGEFDETLLDPFLHIAELTNLTGNLSADIKAKGNSSDLAQIAVELRIENLSVFQMHNGQMGNNSKTVELIRIADLSANLKNGKFVIPQNEIAMLETSRMVVSGSGRMGGDYQLMAKGNVPLMVATAFVPALENPQGKIDFSAKISQVSMQSEFDAEIQFKGIGLTLPTLMQRLYDVNGLIRITKDAVELENVTGRLDTGRLSTEGRIELSKGFTPGRVQMTINAHALPIQVPNTLEVLINSELSFTGTPDNALLSGQVVLLDGLYYRDVEIDIIGEVTRRRRAGPAPSEPLDFDFPYLRNLAIDIEATFRKPFMVDNNLALMTLRPELRINGTLNQPRVTGRAEVAQGTVAYQNIEFNITRGVIDFIDPYRIRPNIDIRAISHVRDWTILLEISGTPDELEFKLTSNPSEEHADILSLLLLGKTTREMAEGSGPAGLTPEQMLVNLLADRLEADIRAGTGLDIFEMEYTKGDAMENDLGIRITVGKALSRHLTVTYGVERKSGETVQQQIAIYKLMEFLSMSAFQDTSGSFGGELRFRLEFR